jgi:hypothetical protein
MVSSVTVQGPQLLNFDEIPRVEQSDNYFSFGKKENCQWPSYIFGLFIVHLFIHYWKNIQILLSSPCTINMTQSDMISNIMELYELIGPTDD